MALSPVLSPRRLSSSPLVALAVRSLFTWLLITLTLQADHRVASAGVPITPSTRFAAFLWTILITAAAGAADLSLRREWPLWHALGYSRRRLLALFAGTAFVGELVRYVVR